MIMFFINTKDKNELYDYVLETMGRSPIEIGKPQPSGLQDSNLITYRSYMRITLYQQVKMDIRLEDLTALKFKFDIKHSLF